LDFEKKRRKEITFSHLVSFEISYASQVEGIHTLTYKLATHTYVRAHVHIRWNAIRWNNTLKL